MANQLWHTKSAQEALSALSTQNSGLAPREAEARKKQYGLNRLPEGKTDSLLKIFLRQFQSPLIYVLMAAAGVVYLMGEYIDAAVVFFVLIFNAITGTIQEGRAQSTLAALKRYAGTMATVVREGKESIISDAEIVPGDIIILQEGEKIPADAKVLESNNLQINESSLTGESVPVRKSAEAITKENLVVADQTNMLFKGTYIVGGSGRAVVVHTGVNTEIGKIAKEISQIETDIPLKNDVARLSRLIVTVVLAISLILLALGLAAQQPIKAILATVVSLAISVIPEGLPIVMTLILAKGVWDMSKRNVLVKRLQAVEALGQTKIIAVDKTGTLTKNEMVVTRVYTAGEQYLVGGSGYAPEGKIFFNDSEINPEKNKAVSLLGRCAALSSGARISLDEETGLWKVAGDPTEAALLIFAEKGGQIKESLESASPKILEVPFDYKAQYHAVVNEASGEKTLTVVGAAEKILSMSSFVLGENGLEKLGQSQKEKIEAAIEAMAKDGLRVVAAGYLENFNDTEANLGKKILVLAGLYGIQDALRAEVEPAMRAVKAAGMKVVMITGDHRLTARAIAEQAGIFKEGDGILSGEEINTLSDDELSKKLQDVSVFYRVTPEHKLKIVRAYKKSGLTVAMTGDGVNDAPSLVAADLGVSMGKIGTEVAKEASDLVLLDDNFGSIVSAVEEGRNIYRTIQKALLFLFSTAAGEVLIISASLVIGTFTGMPLPLLPAQILWVNLVGDGILGIFLAYEPKEPGLLNGKFNKTSKYIIDTKTLWRMAPMSIIMAAGTLGIFIFNYQQDYAKALSLSFTTLAIFQWFNAWNCKSDTNSLFSKNSLKNRAMTYTTAVVIFLHLLALYTPFMQKVFRTTPLGATDWLAVICVASVIIAAEEIRKFMSRKKSVNI